MTITQTGRRVALVGLLALIAAVLPFTGAGAIDGDEALQLSADSNVATSIANSQVVYTPVDGTPDTPPTTVLIGRADVFADNLASGALQDNAPLLLTESDALNADVEAEITRLGATNATILGGEAAISADVEAELVALLGEGNVDRLEGATRTETAIAVAGAAGSDTALLVRNAAAPDSTDDTQAYADSLGAGALAASNGYSVLFSQSDVLTGSTAEYLGSEGGPTSVIIVGGTAAISEEVEAAVAEIVGTDNVSRAAGATRFDTAVELNGLRDADTLGSFAIAVEGQASDSWADGFTMANLSGTGNYPLVLTNNGEVPQATSDYLDSINENAFAAHFTNTFIVCGSSVAGACDALAAAYGLTVVPFPGEDAEPTDNTGVVVSETADAPNYSYVPSGGDAAITIVTDADDDSFTVDGQAATSGVFFSALQPGDTVTVTDNGDGTFTHDLVNVDPSTILEGTVGNVDTTATTFDIIEPVSGVALNTGIDYSGDLFVVDGSPATETSFGLDINEGDTVSISEDDPVDGTDTITLQNQSVSGMVTAKDTTSATETLLQIGALGDDHGSAQDDDFQVDDGATDENLTIDGEDATFAEFTAQVSVGDEITYSREGGEENFMLGNSAPTVLSGIAADVLGLTSNAGNEAEFLPDGEGTTDSFIYADTAQFLVNGILSDVTAFEAALTEGDMVTYRMADAATSTVERVTLEDAPLSGFVSDSTVAVDGAAAGDTVTIDRDSVDGEGVLFDAFALDGDGQFAGTIRYFVDGAEVAYDTAETGFEAVLDGIDADDNPEIVITQTALSVNIDLYPTGQPA